MPQENAHSTDFKSVQVSEGCYLRRKQQYEYTSLSQMYNIELFENQDGTFYAIGVPRDGRVVIYGSNVVSSAKQALSVVVEKIERESPQFESPNADR